MRSSSSSIDSGIALTGNVQSQIKYQPSKGPPTPKLLYEKTSLIRNYPFQYEKEYELDFKRNPKPKSSIVDPKIFPTGKDDGRGAEKILNVYVGRVLEQSQRKHQTQEIRLQHFTSQFLESSFDQQLTSVELNNTPLASSISIQQSLNKPNMNSSQKKFFVHFTNRLKNDDGLLVYARLQNMNINDTTLKYLCSGISRNSRLRILMLHNNFISDKALETLCASLRHHPSIHTLWIGSNRITDFGLKSLSQLISDNTTIKELNLSNKYRKLNFSKEEEDIRPYLTYISADYLANHLKKGSLLSSLTISHQKLYDDGAILLYHALPYCQLRSLNMTNNFLTNKSCLVLQYVLTKNPMLEQLTLCKNQISDTGAIAIAFGLVHNTLLSMLDLSENEIDERGLFALYRSLSMYNKTLKSLITVKNLFDDIRAETIASTRNNSVFMLGIRNSINMSPALKHSGSGENLQKPSLSPDVYLPRQELRKDPTVKELRASLLLHPSDDSHILDEINNINQTIGSITQSTEQQAEEFNTPKLIAKSLSRSSLIRTNTEKQLFTQTSSKEQLNKEIEEEKLPQRPKRSFADLLSSPFGSSDNVGASPMSRISISVPGVEIYGSKPVSLDSIYEEKTAFDEPRTIQEAIASAIRIVDSDELTTDKLEKEHRDQPVLTNFSPTKSKISRKSCDLGKIVGVPNIKSYGIKPIRTSVTDSVDSGQHLLYLRVSTEADPEQSRPYSLIKIGLDRIAERERIKKEHQRATYKEQKLLKLMERPNKTHQEAAISRVSDRFWKDWDLRTRNRYPRGIDLARGCASTKLEPIHLPPAPSQTSTEIDYYSKYDRDDLQNPWNRYLEYKKKDRLAYQRHLGFHNRKFPPGQILAARKKESFLRKIVGKDEGNVQVTQAFHDTANQQQPRMPLLLDRK